MDKNSQTPLTVKEAINLVLPKLARIHLVIENNERFIQCLKEIQNDLQNVEEAGRLKNNTELSADVFKGVLDNYVKYFNMCYGNKKNALSINGRKSTLVEFRKIVQILATAI